MTWGGVGRHRRCHSGQVGPEQPYTPCTCCAASGRGGVGVGLCDMHGTTDMLRTRGLGRRSCIRQQVSSVKRNRAAFENVLQRVECARPKRRRRGHRPTNQPRNFISNAKWPSHPHAHTVATGYPLSSRLQISQPRQRNNPHNTHSHLIYPLLTPCLLPLHLTFISSR